MTMAGSKLQERGTPKRRKARYAGTTQGVGVNDQNRFLADTSDTNSVVPSSRRGAVIVAHEVVTRSSFPVRRRAALTPPGKADRAVAVTMKRRAGADH